MVAPAARREGGQGTEPQDSTSSLSLEPLPGSTEHARKRGHDGGGADSQPGPALSTPHTVCCSVPSPC